MLTGASTSVKLDSMNAEQTQLDRRVALHAALADATRLRIVDLLAVSDRSASELGAALGAPSNLLAHHLRVLESAGVLTRRRSEGDRRRTYLSLADRGELLDRAGAGVADPGIHVSTVLFVCTANTARSHLAAAAWRAVSDVPASSAGTHPGAAIHPGAVAAAERHGLDLPDVAPRLLDEQDRRHSLVVTVCDRAHEELATDWAHWSIPDPVAAGGRRAFDEVVVSLADRTSSLARRVRLSS